METIKEEARRIPVAGEFDICVVGGGCTGVFAAVNAARLGASVAIVEEGGFFGGSATASLVNVWHSLHDVTGRRRIIGGLTMEMIERLGRRDAISTRGEKGKQHYVYNPAELTIELDQLVAEAGVRPFLHTRFVSPFSAEHGNLDAIAVEDRSGRRAIKASNFVDATGDGCLIAGMGLPFRKHKAMQPPTMCALLQGLDEIASRHPDFSLNAIAFDPMYEEALPRGFLWSADVTGLRDIWMVAGTRVFGVDCSDPDQLTRAEMDGRKQVKSICDILRKHFLHKGQGPLVALPARIGVRETRHAKCRHTLTEEEVLHGIRFPDAIANGTYRVDIHLPDAPGVIFRYLDGREEHISPGEHKHGRWLEEGKETASFYQIPYASMVPEGASNVLVAGRIIDADPGAYGAIRVMVNCNQTGEAAGTASHIALKSGVSVGKIGTKELRESLREHGSIVI